MINVASILRRKGPQFNKLEARTHVIDALAIMKSESLDYIIVTKNGKYAGIFSERDYAQKVILMGKTASSTEIGDVMTSSLPHVCYDDSIEVCMMLMTAYRTRFLPIFEEFEFKGVLTMNDLIREEMFRKEHQTNLELVEEEEKVF
jgi:signal-transduction protein with cAMP-binding, CBS, and nucleotidyltransferase domain